MAVYQPQSWTGTISQDVWIDLVDRPSSGQTITLSGVEIFNRGTSARTLSVAYIIGGTMGEDDPEQTFESLETFSLDTGKTLVRGEITINPGDRLAVKLSATLSDATEWLTYNANGGVWRTQ